MCGPVGSSAFWPLVDFSKSKASPKLNKLCIQAGFIGSLLLGVEDFVGSPRYVAIGETDYFQNELK
jgi:hypothetical protein